MISVDSARLLAHLNDITQCPTDTDELIMVDFLVKKAAARGEFSVKAPFALPLAAASDLQAMGYEVTLTEDMPNTTTISWN